MRRGRPAKVVEPDGARDARALERVRPSHVAVMRARSSFSAHPKSCDLWCRRPSRVGKSQREPRRSDATCARMIVTSQGITGTRCSLPFAFPISTTTCGPGTCASRCTRASSMPWRSRRRSASPIAQACARRSTMPIASHPSSCAISSERSQSSERGRAPRRRRATPSRPPRRSRRPARACAPPRGWSARSGVRAAASSARWSRRSAGAQARCAW